jgi:hypothetical protein
MKRLLLAAALGASLFAATSTPASACEFRQCAWGMLICSKVSCPRYCYTVSEVHKTFCVIN